MIIKAHIKQMLLCVNIIFVHLCNCQEFNVSLAFPDKNPQVAIIVRIPSVEVKATFSEVHNSAKVITHTPKKLMD